MNPGRLALDVLVVDAAQHLGAIGRAVERVAAALLVDVTGLGAGLALGAVVHRQEQRLQEGPVGLAVEQAVEAFTAAGITAARIPVSHAFHTSIVAPSSEPLRNVLRRLDVRPPRLPIVANVTGGALDEPEEIRRRLVEQIGLSRLLRKVFAASTLSVTALLVTALATGGRPPFWLFVLLLSAVLFFHQMLIPNLNAAAMRPLAAVAGTGTAILNMVPGVVGAIIAEVINRQFDGTITPLAIGFVISSAVAGGMWYTADRTSKAPTLHSGSRIE